MIGQLEVINRLKETKARSVLLTGPPHWGKKTLLREIFREDDSVYEVSGNASTFRETLDRIYSTVRPTLYLIPDIDKTNATVQNLLLKVLEEPPLSSRFYLTSSGSVLPTISSRCVTYRMQPYTEQELASVESLPALIGIGRSPGEMKLLDFEGSDILASELKEIIKSVDSHSLAFVLKIEKEFEKHYAEIDVDYSWFLILVRELCEPCASVDWLRQQPRDGLKYVRKQFFMKYWLERRS